MSLAAITDILQRYGFVPVVRKQVGTAPTPALQCVPAVPIVPTLKSKGENKAAAHGTTVSLRAHLLVLAEQNGFDLAHVHRLHDLDVIGCDGLNDAQLVTYLELLDDTATRWAGKVSAGHDAAILCHHCGPVLVHPGMAAVLPVVAGWPRAAGCPWCFVRKAGGHIPRPRVTCETCSHFQPDTINPAASAGGCASGHGKHYPMLRHGCSDFAPRNEQ
jgi:hypothetical protein